MPNENTITNSLGNSKNNITNSLNNSEKPTEIIHSIQKPISENMSNPSPITPQTLPPILPNTPEAEALKNKKIEPVSPPPSPSKPVIKTPLQKPNTSKNIILPLVLGGILGVIAISTGSVILLKDGNKTLLSNNQSTEISFNNDNNSDSLNPVITTSLFTTTPSNNDNNPNFPTNSPTGNIVVTTSISNNNVTSTPTSLTTAPTSTTKPGGTNYTNTPTPVPTKTFTPTPTPTQALSKYINGTYSADGSYYVPDAGGNETIGLSLTINNDNISGIVVTAKGPSGDSYQWQDLFKSGIEGSSSYLVIGKPLDTTFTFTKINGSSLTYKGFRAALPSI